MRPTVFAAMHGYGTILLLKPIHWYLEAITLDEKVGYKQEKSSSEGITFCERLRDTQTFWQISLL